MGILDQVRQVEIKECVEPLVRLDFEEFVLEPLYFEWGFSNTKFIQLREGAVECLRKAKTRLPKGWNFKIWDGFRTLETQQILYKNYWQVLRLQNSNWNDAKLKKAVEIFVSIASQDRRLPSPHNTGGAVDLTLVNGHGEELAMGTPFDEFTEKSFTDYFKEGEFFENRKLLREILEGAGFVNYPQEWWHFSCGDQFWAKCKKEPAAIYGSLEL